MQAQIQNITKQLIHLPKFTSKPLGNCICSTGNDSTPLHSHTVNVYNT